MTLCLVLAFLANSGMAQSNGGNLSEPPRALILISIDGFRWDYAERYGAPHLLELGEEGVRAEGLIPVFPTKTFPNHYTLVTGLRADQHGVVANNFYDPSFDARFKLGERASMTEQRWWGGEPLWVSMERAGRRSATLFWPGSEVSFDGVRPTHWKAYNSGLPDDERVDEVLGWLDLDAAKRPEFITLYFSRVDTAGHLYGPDSEEVAKAVRDVDLNLGRLFDGLERRELTDHVDVVVVSDHGMAALDHTRLIVLEEHIELTKEEVVSLSPLLAIWTERIPAADLVRTLDAVPHLRAWAREDLPERFYWKDNVRIPPVVALADDGWRIVRRANLESLTKRKPGGGHGFDNRETSMRGIFFARGPSFKRGQHIAAFDSVHVYSLLTAALRLKPLAHDGDLTVVEPLLNLGTD